MQTSPLPETLPSTAGDVAGQVASLAGSGTTELAIDHVWRHSWPWPIWLAVVLFVAATAMTVWSVGREAGVSRLRRAALIGLRVALLSLLTFMMFGWWISRHHSVAPDLVLVIDDSRSMAHVDGYNAEMLSRYVDLVAEARTLPPAASDNGARDPSLPSDPGPTRWDIARAWLLQDNARRLRNLAAKYRLRVYLAAETLDPLPTKLDALITALREQPGPSKSADGSSRRDGSRLGDLFRQVTQAQQGRSTSAIILMSDGVTTSGPLLSDAAEKWRRRDTPWLTIGMGLEGAAKDVAVADLLAPPSAFVGDLVALQARIDSSGYAGRPARVRLVLEGESQPRAEELLTLNGGRQNVELSCRIDEPGEARIRFEVEPLEGEATINNNSQQATVRVRDEAIRVLLIEGAPRWEYRSLKFLLGRSLQRDGESRKSIELQLVLQEGDSEFLASEPAARPAAPATEAELFEFDVVILGDANPNLMTRTTWKHLKAFVEERGGGLIVIAGERFDPLSYRDTALADLLPVRLETALMPQPGRALREGFVAEPSAFGASFPSLQVGASAQESREAWKTMPELRWLLEAPDVRSGCWTLLQHPTRRADDGRPLPVTTLRFAGAGKVLFHATDESYRWSRHDEGPAYYERYWLQTLRYLSRAKLLGGDRAVELTTDREVYRGGDSVLVRARFLDERVAPVEDQAVEALVEMEQGRRRKVQLARSGGQRGVFEATLDKLEPGRYRLWLIAPALEGDPPAANFEIQQPPGELARLEMDADQLRDAAQATGGAYFPFFEADSLWSRLPPGKRVQIEPLPPEPIWNSSILAGLFIVIIVSEWFLRKRWDLY